MNERFERMRNSSNFYREMALLLLIFWGGLWITHLARKRGITFKMYNMNIVMKIINKYKIMNESLLSQLLDMLLKLIED
jgi:hypothetical protein